MNRSILINQLILFSIIFLLGHTTMARPDFPIRNIDTRTIQKINGTYTTMTPHLPVHDLSLDGRIGLQRKPRVDGKPGALPIYVLKPKKVVHHLKHPANPKVGANIIDSQPYSNFNLRNLLQKYYSSQLVGYNQGRTILCEKTDIRKSPFVCDDGISDCYRLTLVTRHIKELGRLDKIRQTAIDVIVKVKNPKTQQARIEFVHPMPRTRKITDPMDLVGLSEPVIVGDGRLFIVRVYDTAVTGSVGRSNIVYSVYPEGKEQCNPKLWQTFRPVSHAYHDPNMRRRYKFARYPLRDGIGRLIPDGHDLGGSYQWMDKDAANLFFWAYGRDRYYNKIDGVVKGIYPEYGGDSRYTSAHEVSSPGDLEEASLTAGLSMAGFWTHGKTITFDGLLNNADYNFQISNPDIAYGEMTRRIKLYNQTPAGQYFERMGMQRERGNEVETSAYHPVLAPNSSFIGSIENRLNYVDQAKPVTPRDLVWFFGSTRHSEELAFDDFVSPYVLINAEMTGAVGLPWRAKKMTNFDGYKNGRKTNHTLNDFYNDNNSTPLAFQNAASAPDSFMKVPRAGVPVGNLRLEPIAKGGIHGKGLWMEPKTGLKFYIPNQSGADFEIGNRGEWYVSVFLDPRYNRFKPQPFANIIKLGNKVVRLVKWKKASPQYDHVAYDAIQLLDNGQPVGYFNLPNHLKFYYEDWKHLGIDFGVNHGAAIYINGFRLGLFNPSKGKTRADIKAFFRPTGNKNIFLGSHTSTDNLGFKGWVDDFKVIARRPTYEEKCNYARGTLVRLGGENAGWLTAANRYPAWVHREIASLAGENSSNKYVCYVRYGQRLMENFTPQETFAHLKNLNSGMVSVREKLITEQRKLRFGKPRPAHGGNSFCLSCHVEPAFNPNKELNRDALVWNSSVKAQYDPRRQPMQPAQYIRGVIPASYFGPGKPRVKRTDQDEYLIDQWVLPRD